MKPDIICDAFSMAEITLFHNTIALNYDGNQNGYWLQSFEDNNLDFLCDLVSVSTSIKAMPFRNGKMRITFCLPDSIDFPDLVVFKPKKRLYTFEETKKIMVARAIEKGITEEEIKKNEELITSFVDPNANEEVFLMQVQNLMNCLYEQERKEHPIDFKSHTNYPSFKEAVIGLMKHHHHIDLEAPSDDLGGVATLTANMKDILIVKGVLKTAVLNLLEVSKVFEISGDVRYETLDLEFYS